MNSLNFKKHIVEIKEEANKNIYLLEKLKYLSSIFDELSPFIFNLFIYSGNDLINKQHETKNKINDYINNIKNKIELYKLYSEINSILKTIENLSVLDFNMFEITVKSFLTSYEKFVKNYDYNCALDMLSNSKYLFLQYDSLLKLLNSISSSLEESIEIKDNTEIIELEFFKHYDLNEIGLKLNSLTVIYTELCYLFNISEAEYKFDVIKIETGSLLNKLIGHEVIIKEIISLITSFVQFLHSQYSKEGKIEKLGKNLEVIDKVLNITSRLEEHDIDTSKIKENIQKTSIKLSEKLFDLFACESKVKIQNDILKISEYDDQKYIEDGKKIFLTDDLNKTLN